MKRINLQERRFGRLVVLSKYSIIDKETYWDCKCDCGSLKTVRRKSLMDGSTRSCGCIYRTQRNHLWKGVGEISSAYWTSVRHNAKKRNINFSITIKEGWDLFIKQNRKCYFTNIELTLVTNYINCKLDQTASLDRIDPYKGYTLDNVRWVHKSINQMKMRLSDMEFIELCFAVTEANLPILEAGKR